MVLGPSAGSGLGYSVATHARQMGLDRATQTVADTPAGMLRSVQESVARIAVAAKTTARVQGEQLAAFYRRSVLVAMR
jgi:hypothetical protein